VNQGPETAFEQTHPLATGIGSLPGDDPLEAARSVLGLLAAEPGLPYLPELPSRGPGADLTGRGAAFLVDLPVDLQPSGWRLVDRPGRDLRRAQSFLSHDTDALAEAADGYQGRLKLQVAGPWTLGATVWLPRGDRLVTDPGATRDLVESLAEGLARHIEDVRRLLPGAEVVIQLDEPALPAVLAGRLPTMSGFGRLRAVEPSVAQDALTMLVRRAHQAGAVATVLHCCDADVPIALLRGTGVTAIALDTTLLGDRGWESVAFAVEGGTQLWAGLVPATGEPAALPAVSDLVEQLRAPWRRVGLELELLAGVTVTPSCGMTGASPEGARQTTVRTMEVARELAEVSAS